MRMRNTRPPKWHACGLETGDNMTPRLTSQGFLGFISRSLDSFELFPPITTQNRTQIRFIDSFCPRDPWSRRPTSIADLEPWGITSSFNYEKKGASNQKNVSLKVLDQSPGIQKVVGIVLASSLRFVKNLGIFPIFSPPIGTKFAIWFI